LLPFGPEYSPYRLTSKDIQHYSFVLYYTGMKVKEEHRLWAYENAMLRRILDLRERKYRRMVDSMTYIPRFIICSVLFTQHY
jgi:hypothetical protein